MKHDYRNMKVTAMREIKPDPPPGSEPNMRAPGTPPARKASTHKKASALTQFNRLMKSSILATEKLNALLSELDNEDSMLLIAETLNERYPDALNAVDRIGKLFIEAAELARDGADLNMSLVLAGRKDKSALKRKGLTFLGITIRLKSPHK